jgi:hypothetical protein
MDEVSGFKLLNLGQSNNVTSYTSVDFFIFSAL